MGRLAYLMVCKAEYYDSAATALHEREKKYKKRQEEKYMTEMEIYLPTTERFVRFP